MLPVKNTPKSESETRRRDTHSGGELRVVAGGVRRVGRLLGAEIADLEATLESILEAHDQVSDLTATIPELRSALEDAHDETDED